MEAEWHAVADPASRGREPYTEYQLRRWGFGGREHFGDPWPGDLGPGQAVERARASWEPLGLPAPGMVYLAGRVVHRFHECASICQYRSGWYPAERAAQIVSSLPSPRIPAAQIRSTVVPFSRAGAA